MNETGSSNPEGAEDFIAPDLNSAGNESESENIPKIEDVEDTDQNPSELEWPELSPEVFQQIMEKVKYINEPGTAFTSIGAFGKKEKDKDELIQSVMKNGVLGTDRFDSPYDIDPVETWVRNVREGRNARVYFNVIGRRSNDDTNRSPQFRYFLPMAESEYVIGGSERLIVLFDLEKYSNQSKHTWSLRTEPYGMEIPQKSRTYRESLSTTGHGAYGTTVDEDHGFNLSYRVPPKFFNGVVIKILGPERDPTELRELAQGDLRQTERLRFLPATEEQKAQRAMEVARLMVVTDADDPKLLVPIYDIDGDLLWPTKMSVKEIQEMVTARSEADENNPN